MEERTDTEAQALTKGKPFKKFEIKDIVFLAILSAVMLLTGGVMPLVTGVPLFGIIQLALALQFSIIPAIGLMKVRKPGTLLFMAMFSGVVLIFMFVPMFFCIVLCAILAEMLALLIFKGYDKDVACWFAATIYLPLSLPFLLVYFKLFGFTNNGAAVQALTNPVWWVAVLITLAVCALTSLGAFVGVKIAKELKKSGVMKK
ncbi:MAG: hypothetical protein IJR55_00945 [Clostridia bacterium]|nr:hypothetical protein [Clostridia bacterium]